MAYRDSYHAHCVYSGGIFLDYEWKPVPTDTHIQFNLRSPGYKPAQEWPRYDFNHHNNGMPQSIRKLYDQNPEIVARFNEHREKALQELKS